MLAAEAGFKANGGDVPAGSFLIPADGNPSDLRVRLEKAVAELGLTVQALAEIPKVATHPLAAPRVALVHTWLNTQNEGWFRLALDGLGIPYSYISDQVLRDTGDLRARFDVILFGPVNGSSQRIVNGVPRRGAPIPWKKSDLTPNFGTSARPGRRHPWRHGTGGADERSAVRRRRRAFHHPLEPMHRFRLITGWLRAFRSRSPGICRPAEAS